ncbi:hypothetical protein VNI00_002364 [Paramarasmius palmivorus]|uniref:DUF427 domain-containing protein n=1 Tax=Paramarasmius palmivorus TaxID=297713 RepID=A0AAW0DYQ7_9AGAR
MKATLNGNILADSDETVVVEGNHYFPPSSIKKEYFTDSSTRWDFFVRSILEEGLLTLICSTVCPWKGTASYYDASIDGNTVKDIAWYYPSTFEKAKHIEGYVAFYKNKVTFE